MWVHVMFDGADVRSTDGRRMFGSSRSNTDNSNKVNDVWELGQLRVRMQLSDWLGTRGVYKGWSGWNVAVGQESKLS